MFGRQWVQGRQWARARTAGLAAVVLVVGLTMGTATAATAGTTLDGSKPGLTQATSASPCQDVVFIGAEGSGETWDNGTPMPGSSTNYHGLGDEVAHALDYYANQLSNYRIGWYAIPYPSAAADFLSLLTNSYRGVFFSSIDSGVNDTETFLTARASRCPYERYVLAGYSQGAMVMHRVLNRLAQNQTTPTSATSILPRVDGGIAVADGDRVGAGTANHCFDTLYARYKAQGGATYGNASQCGLGVSWRVTLGQSGITYKPKAASIPNSRQWPASRWHDICMDVDLICDTQVSVLGIPTGLDIHSNAYKLTGTGGFAGTGVPAVNQAIDDLAVQTRTHPPAPQVRLAISSTSTVAYGSDFSPTVSGAGGTPFPTPAPTYTWTLTTTGVNNPFTISSAGVVHGIATNPGVTTVTITVTDVAGTWSSQTFDVTITGGPTPLPTPSGALTDVAAIAAGADAGYALRSDGSVWSWGGNDSGQLGNGTLTTSSVPVQVQGLTGITAIAGGESDAYAVRNDGTVWGWGANDSGQLGNGTLTTSSVPVQVQGLSGVTAVVSLRGVAYAVRNDGSVWAWGSNGFGQLEPGDTTTTYSSVPVQVRGLSQITAIAGDDRDTYALRSDGTVWVWGQGCYVAPGITPGGWTYPSTPEQVAGLTGVSAIAGTGISAFIQGLALRNDGSVWDWATNVPCGNQSVAAQLEAPDTTSSIASNFYNLYGLHSDGTAWAWGDNRYGGLGNGTTTYSSTPVVFLADVKALAGGPGGAAGYALRNDGTVWAWGLNGSGQLGSEQLGVGPGPFSYFASPVQVGG